MSAMNMPGFTAETSLYKAMINYRTKGVSGSLPGAVLPQLTKLPPVPGCGVWTPLRWPNGTPTGTCARDCCDVSGHCRIETSPCVDVVHSKRQLGSVIYVMKSG